MLWRDSGRALRACALHCAAKQPAPEDDDDAAAGGGEGLVDELERLSKLHLDGCLDADEFAQAKKCLLAAARL